MHTRGVAKSWCTSFLFVVLFLALSVAPSVRADNIAPGGSGSPDIFTSSPFTDFLTPLAVSTPSFGSGDFSGSLTEEVFSDPSNVFCAGCLDFTFFAGGTSTVGNNGLQIQPILVTQITDQSFAGFSTDAGIASDLGTGGGCTPLDVGPNGLTRSSDGSTLAFLFPSRTQGSPCTPIMEIMTNATSFTTGSLSLFGVSSTGNVIDTVSTFAPSSSTAPPTQAPEPSTLLLLAIGLLALVVGRTVYASGRCRC
jgi:hypothetical protein